MIRFLENHQISKKYANLIGWFLFALFFAWFWRVYDLINQIPAYGDALEVIWGIEWYGQALRNSTSPSFYPLLMHPFGWQVGTLAHTPFIFALAQPLNFLGGPGFAYNILAIASFIVAFVGAKKYLGLFTSTWTAILLALVFTFINFRASRVTGHLHSLWATSMLPWIAFSINRVLEESRPKFTLLPGIFCGLMINFSLYGLFWSVFFVPLLIGKQIFSRKGVTLLLTTALTALVLSLPVGVYFWSSSNLANTLPPDISQLAYWGSSVNSFFATNPIHPFPPLAAVGRSLYSGPVDESGLYNLGVGLSLTLVVGSIALWLNDPENQRLSERFSKQWVIFLVGMVLATGPFLKMNGEYLSIPIINELTGVVWSAGKLVKHEVFSNDVFYNEIKEAVPMPYAFLLVGLPLLESARASARFAFFALIGGLGASGIILDRLKMVFYVPLMLFVLIEALPTPFTGMPLPTGQIHPAYDWLLVQSGNEAIHVLELHSDGTFVTGGEVLLASWHSNIPSANAVGSFISPRELSYLEELFDWRWQLDSDIEDFFRSQGINYLLITQPNSEFQKRLNEKSDSIVLIDCFLPYPHESPWPHTMCVYEVSSYPDLLNTRPNFGWSPLEEWGQWSIEQETRSSFYAIPGQTHELILTAFPHCVDNQNQSITLLVNDQFLSQFEWRDCDPISLNLAIPETQVEKGWNEIKLQFAYAISPAELGSGSDPRTLTAGFTQFQVIATP